MGSKLKNPPAEVYLTDVVDFVGFLRRANPRLAVGVALQGLAGLQLQEATRLTWDRVDLETGLIEISGVVKNEYRNRVIPVMDIVKGVLKQAHDARERHGGPVREVREPVVASAKGFAYGEWWVNYSKEVSGALKSWNSKIPWKPKDLRNCLPTFAVMEGLLNDVWEQYLGHAPRSVTARHYVPRLASVSAGEGEALEMQMNLFRLHVLEPLQRTIEAKSGRGILKNFERSGAQPPDVFKISSS